LSFKEAFAFLAFSPSFGCPSHDPVIIATVSVLWSVFVIGGSLHCTKNLQMIYLYTKKKNNLLYKTFILHIRQAGMLISFIVIVTRGAEMRPCHHLSSLFIKIQATLQPQDALQLLNGIPFTLCHQEFTENN
jgi:hypothetical protein